MAEAQFSRKELLGRGWTPAAIFRFLGQADAMVQRKIRGWSYVDDARPARDATADSDPAFLARIEVNYLRHSASTYDAQLQKANRFGERGRELARAVKSRVLQVIAEVYPELSAECARQEVRHV